MRHFEYSKVALKFLKEGKSRGLAFFIKKHFSCMCQFAIAIIGSKKEAEAISGEVFRFLYNERLFLNDPYEVNVFLYFTTWKECEKLLQNSTNLNRVKEDSPYFDKTAELLIGIMKQLEKKRAKGFFISLFEIEFNNPSVSFKIPESRPSQVK